MDREEIKVKSIKRILCSALAAAIAAGTAGCASSSGTASPASAAGTASAAASQAAGAPVTLKVEVFDRGVQGNAPVENNKFTAWINETFGKPNNITVQFVACPRSSEEDKLNMWMGSGDAPDIVFTYNATLFYRYASQGGLQPLDDALAKYGKELGAFIGTDNMAYGKAKNVQYAVPTKRGVIQGMGVAMMRQDWLDKIGMKAPANTEELYRVLKAFYEKDPGGLGTDTIPWVISLKPEMNRGYWSMGYSFYDWSKIDDKMWNTAPDVALPGYKDSLRFLNRLYNEHLVSADFALDTDGKKATADFSAGKGGMMCANLGAADLLTKTGAGYACRQNVPTATFVTCDPFTGSGTAYPKYNRVTSMPFGMFLMVPKTSKNADAAIKYLNWMCGADVLMTYQYGTEGVNYKMENGVPVVIQDDTQEKYTRLDYTLVENGNEFSDIRKHEDAVLVNYDEAFRPAVKAAMLNTFERYKQWPYLPVTNTQNDKYGAALGTMKDDLVVKSIMAPAADFDATFDSLQKSYMESGGQAVWDEAQKLYDQVYSK